MTKMCLNKAIEDSKKIRNTKLWLLLSLGIVVAFCVAFFVRSHSFSVPTWVLFEEKEITSKNGLFVTLSDGKVSVKDSESAIKWSLGDELKVQDILLSDLDGDEIEELIALVWKKGKYGKDMPFWVSQNDNELSQHIFIYELMPDGNVKQKWFASDIGQQISRMKMMEKNSMILLTETVSGENNLWKWDSFGLKTFKNKVTFVAFGDNIIHSEIYDYAYKAQKGNFDFLYEPFKEEIESADIAAIQAETILVDKDSAVSGYPYFGSPLAVGEAIAKAGFDIAVCGNNHALDKGIYGIDVTTDFYDENGVICIGIQSSFACYEPYKLISRNGIKFALFSYTYGTNGIDISEKYPYAVHYLPKISEESSYKPETVDSVSDEASRDEVQNKLSIISDITSARNKADIVIVFVHWGEEYSTEITEEQKYYAEVFARAGADVVIGTHPHVIQEMETITRPDGEPMTIFYSLGNFRAYQGFSSKTQTGAEAKLTFEHTYDGVRLTDVQMNEINAYVELK